jgi:predicted SnoaL-like aldol condensation-catalyzing enzyme
MKKHVSFTSVILLVAAFSTFSCSNGQESGSRESLKAANDSLMQQLGKLHAIEQQEEANKMLVSQMYQELFGDKNVEAADKYIVENYIQHNPNVADGRAALKEALGTWFKNAPKETIDIQHLSADGDLVYIHTRSKMGGQTVSIIDIFRVEDSTVVEHWDVIQEVPAKAANDHPMF